MTTYFDDAPGEPDGVPVLWAWIAVDTMGGEGIIAAVIPGIGATPLVTAREGNARGRMRRAVNALPKAGRRFELRRYELAETVVKL